MTPIRFISLVKLYLQRGYSLMSIPLSVFNSSIIIYTLLIKKLSFIPESIKHFKLIIPIFTLTFIMFCVIIGYFDYRKGTFKVEQEKMKELSPNFKLLHSKLDLIIKQGKKDKIK